MSNKGDESLLEELSDTFSENILDRQCYEILEYKVGTLEYSFYTNRMLSKIDYLLYHEIIDKPTYRRIKNMLIHRPNPDAKLTTIGISAILQDFRRTKGYINNLLEYTPEYLNNLKVCSNELLESFKVMGIEQSQDDFYDYCIQSLMEVLKALEDNRESSYSKFSEFVTVCLNYSEVYPGGFLAPVFEIAEDVFHRVIDDCAYFINCIGYNSIVEYYINNKIYEEFTLDTPVVNGLVEYFKELIPSLELKMNPDNPNNYECDFLEVEKSKFKFIVDTCRYRGDVSFAEELEEYGKLNLPSTAIDNIRSSIINYSTYISSTVYDPYICYIYNSFKGDDFVYHVKKNNKEYGYELARYMSNFLDYNNLIKFAIAVCEDLSQFYNQDKQYVYDSRLAVFLDIFHKAGWLDDLVEVFNELCIGPKISSLDEFYSYDLASIDLMEEIKNSGAVRSGVYNVGFDD